MKTIIEQREDLAKLIDELGLKTGAELGVNLGKFSEFLLGSSKLEKLYSIDAWQTDESSTKAVFKQRAAVVLNKCYEEAKQRLSKYGERSRIIKKTTFDAVKDFEDNSLDFVYIDASHRFSGVALDLIQWYPKVRPGGIFAGHDYWSCYRCEVMDAVNGFFVENKQILRITTKGLNAIGNVFYPPTWWCIKQNLTKKEYNQQLKEAIKILTAQKRYLEEQNGVKITLPYQYSEV